MFKKIFLFVFIAVSGPLFSLAAQSFLVKDDLTLIDQPQLAKIFYGQLTGQAHVYRIEATESFDLYLSLSVPDLKESQKDISIEIKQLKKDREELVALLEEAEWSSYYDKQTGDHFFQGPEFKAEATDSAQGVSVPAGSYLIKVFSEDNLGKYSLRVGQIDNFSLEGIIESIKILPQLKTDFFGKSVFSILLSRIGLYIAIGGIIFLIIIFVIIESILRLRLKIKQLKKEKHNQEILAKLNKFKNNSN